MVSQSLILSDKMELPTKRDYDNFVREFSEELSKRHQDVCFYLYGSYPDGRANLGRSDIDGGLILNADFVTDKGQVRDLAEILKRYLINHKLIFEKRKKTQFNLLDRGTDKDGRFLSYTSDFTDWIKNIGKIISGPDYVREMKGLDFRTGPLHAAAFNFRRIRNGLLYSSFNLSLDKGENFRESLEKSMEALASLPKKLILIQQGILYPSRPESKRKITEMLPTLDLSTLEKVDFLFNRPRQLYESISNTGVALQLYQKVLTAYEEMLKAYVEEFPEVSEKEVKGQSIIL